MNALNTIELPVLDWIAEHLYNPVLDVLMPLITMLGDHGIFWMIVALVCLVFKKTRRLGVLLGASFLLGLIFGNGIMKNAFQRIRPYDMPGAMYSAKDLLVSALSDYSFPSGHTLIMTEAATVLMLRARNPWGWIASLAALLVMFSRLYLYVHYPSDVLFGALFGILFGVISVVYVGKLYDQIEEKIKYGIKQ